MPYKKYPSKKYKKPTRLETVKKMTGSTPKTQVEKIASSGKGAMSIIAASVAKVMQLINVETKYYDYTQSLATVPNDGSYLATLNGITAGLETNQRVGEKVVNDKLIVNYSAKVSSAATHSVMRIAIVLDKKPEIGSATYINVYGTNDPIAQVNKDNGDRFIILKTQTIKLTSQSNQSQVGKMIIPLNKIHTQWNTGSGTDFSNNKIMLFAMADEATNYPTLGFNSRINFYDN